MGKKLALNVFYNIAIFVCLIIGYSGIEHKRYEYVLGTVFLAALLIVFKIKLIKEIKAANKQ